MKFNVVLNEKFKTGLEIGSNYVEVFEEPSKKEFTDLIHSSDYGAVRFGLTNTKKPKIYAWDSNLATHHQILKHPKGVKFDVGFIFERSHPETLSLFGDSKSAFLRLTYGKEIIAKVRKLAPLVNRVDFAGYGIDV